VPVRGFCVTSGGRSLAGLVDEVWLCWRVSAIHGDLGRGEEGGDVVVVVVLLEATLSYC
jgi:hypothetical protein